MINSKLWYQYKFNKLQLDMWNGSAMKNFCQFRKRSGKPLLPENLLQRLCPKYRKVVKNDVLNLKIKIQRNKELRYTYFLRLFHCWNLNNKQKKYSSLWTVYLKTRMCQWVMIIHSHPDSSRWNPSHQI